MSNPGKTERLCLQEHDFNVLVFPCLFSFNIYLGAAVTTCWNMNALSPPCFVSFVLFLNISLHLVVIIIPLGEAVQHEDVKGHFCCIFFYFCIVLVPNR